MKKIILDHYFTAYINIKPKWIKQSNIRAEIIKLLQEIIGKNLHKFGHDNGQWFLDLIPKAQATKGKIDKLEFLKIKKIFVYQRTLSGKRQLMKWRKYLQII